MLGIIKIMFIVLLSSIVNASNYTKCVSWSNQKCTIQLTFINLHPNEYSQELHYYQFSVKLDRCAGRCNTLNDISNKVSVPNKTEDLNLNMFNMITGINGLKKLTKHISCKCKRKFDGRNRNSDQWWNNDKCRCECKKRHVCEKGYVWNAATCNCENGKYLASIMDDLEIMCDETIEPYEEETNFNKIKQPVKCKMSIFYLHFY